MTPNQNVIFNNLTSSLQPVSRTYQYRKVMKPMLERKRRARINRCLEELKMLMSSALQSDGESISKLEKADILEITVKHLHNLRSKNSLYVSKKDVPSGILSIERFWQGFGQCSRDITDYLLKLNHKNGPDVLRHINYFLNDPATAKSPIIAPSVVNRGKEILNFSNRYESNTFSYYNDRENNIIESHNHIRHCSSLNNKKDSNFNKNCINNSEMEKGNYFNIPVRIGRFDETYSNVWRPW